MITINLNGKSEQAKEGITVLTFLQEKGLDPHQVAVERNLEIIDPGEMAKTVLKNGDSLEILRFVGGG